MGTKNEFVLWRKVAIVQSIPLASFSLTILKLFREPFVHIVLVKEPRSIALIGSPVKHSERTNVVKLADHAVVGIANDTK